MPSSEVMHKFGSGDLHSGGPGGPKVTNQKQAVAIMLSEKRKEAAHGGKYPESHAEGGPVAKGYMGKETSYAQGGAVLPRSGDWTKTVPNRGFLDTPDRFRGEDDKGNKGDKTLDVWGKGESKANPRANDKSEKPVKPR